MLSKSDYQSGKHQINKCIPNRRIERTSGFTDSQVGQRGFTSFEYRNILPLVIASIYQPLKQGHSSLVNVTFK